MDKKSQALELLNECFEIEGEARVDPQGRVSIQGSVSYLRAPKISPRIKHLPVEFDSVTGDFWASNKNLKGWKNFPQTVTNMLVVDNNKIADWNGCPQSVGSLLISKNPIKNLQGMPKITCSLDAGYCDLENLLGITQVIPSWVNLRGNPLKSLDGFLGCGGYIALTYMPQLPLLKTLLAKQGVMLYANDQDTDDIFVSPSWDRLSVLEKILNSYKGQGKMAVFDCQKELEDAGFEDNARW